MNPPCLRQARARVGGEVLGIGRIGFPSSVSAFLSLWSLGVHNGFQPTDVTYRCSPKKSSRSFKTSLED